MLCREVYNILLGQLLFVLLYVICHKIKCAICKIVQIALFFYIIIDGSTNVLYNYNCRDLISKLNSIYAACRKTEDMICSTSCSTAAA